MIPANNVVVDVSLIEQFRYFLSHEPPILGLILAYAMVCIFMFWVTRSRGYLISFLASWLYLVPFWVH
jgi:hypothetical protein